MHKLACSPKKTAKQKRKDPVRWYEKYRHCRDGNAHEGALELITWPATFNGVKTGWGHIEIEYSDNLKQKFEKEFDGDEEKLFLFYRRAFRWTCCGTHANMDWGCDHHGSGRNPCSCDFCHMGKPLPDSIFYEKTASRHGLTNLLRGPDPRSYHSGVALNTVVNRVAMKLPMFDL
ncbi:hypothetical protein BDN70DRAFT_830152 [Pholiota conissans]|uniref:Uncharacterized protein n=1 Tax=Pholiota conissans TaxID=109636 RepID=A0A9P6D2Y1_9AGAR|nr:hypothetical protein BDN70DRAFT_830152 [Pholiota conissans]